jgi:uncharacterized protein YndB with AHSA1/START domain
MPKPFRVTKEIVAPVPTEDVWLALATGEGMDGWFLGTGNEIAGSRSAASPGPMVRPTPSSTRSRAATAGRPRSVSSTAASSPTRAGTPSTTP